MIGRAAVAVGVVVASLVATTPADADEPLATVDEPTPVVAAGSTVGWLTGAGIVAYQAGRGPVVVTRVRAGEDLSAGLDARGRATFTWSVCRRATRRCTILAWRPGQAAPRRIARIPRVVGQPPVPTLAGRRLLTARRVAPVKGRFCNAPFVTVLGSRRPARALRPGVCGQVVDMHADGGRVLVRIDYAFVRSGNSTEGLRLLRLDGQGRRRIVTAENAGERPNTIGGFGRRGATVTYALPGGFDKPSLLRRFDLRTGREREVTPHETLWGGYGVRYLASPVGGYAPIGTGAAYLRQTIVPDTSNAFCTPVIPCTVVRGGDPFGRRTLARTVRLDHPRRRSSTITGRVERMRVDGPRVRDRIGVAGVPVELLAAGDAGDDGDPDSTTPTGLQGVTDAQGRFAIAVPEPAFAVDYVARTADDEVAAVGYVPVG